MEETRQPRKQGNTAESQVEDRAITIASLPPHVSIGSLTIERLAHQMPDTVNHRPGPHPGRPFMCLMRRTTGPQAREPSNCLNGRATEKDWPKKPSDHQATRGSKKDSDRPITPAAEAVHVPVHLAPPGSPQAKQLHHLHTQLSLGQSCHRQKVLCLCAQGHFGQVQLFATL